MGILDKILLSLFGNKAQRDLKEVEPFLKSIQEAYGRVSTLSNDELRALSAEIRMQVRSSVKDEEAEIARLKAEAEYSDANPDAVEEVYTRIDKIEKDINLKIEEKLNEVLPVAFSIVKETAKRFKENEILEVTASDFDRDLAAVKSHVTIEGSKALWKNRWMAGGNEIVWDMVHYDVQLIGGVVLHQGKIAEMATGEGKTLVATLPVFLNALAGRGVHLVTVNDYLAKRDSEWMGPIYEFHGLSVDCIDRHQPNSEARRKAYNADITFGTNNEFGFDYLRDNMAISMEDLVQRKHHYAIVDEVDSVLIDDARTPLIISGPVPRGENQLFEEYKAQVDELVAQQRQLVTQILAEAKSLISKGDQEKGGLLLLRAYKGLPKNKALIKFLSEPGNKQLLIKTENFYMQENNKNMHVATDLLYFVIDEKHNTIDLTDKGHERLSARTGDTNFFVMPDIGAVVADLEKAGLTPEEKVVQKDELLRDYAIKSERIHTVTQLLKAYTLFENDVEYVVIENKVKIVDEQTGRIMEGRRYSDGLHQAIEAKENVKVEAATQTMATITLQNYFRMYHKLAGMTGTAETEAGELWNIYKLDVVVIPTNKPIVRKDHEDLVYRTKREKYNAVIVEIVSLVEKGRPVLVGTTSVETSELLSRMLGMRNIKHNVLNAKMHQREAEIVAEAGRAGTVTIATNMAGRGTDIKLTAEVRTAGGLAIIGTERHESRRVDRQLRGRSGRQGDPGTSQFFVSLEDDLMRLFGSQRIAGLMDKMGFKDGEVIQHSMITKSIERAQKKVEENNFGIRKRLLEYDDVMNSQREVIYTKRRHALDGERVGIDISNMMYDVVELLVNQYHDASDFEGFRLDVIKYFSIDIDMPAADFLKSKPEDLTEEVMKMVRDAYVRKSDQMRSQTLPVIRNVYETHGANYENIVVPITDGLRMFQILTNLKKSYESEGREMVRSLEKSVVLLTVDEAWKEHLRELDELKQSVQNATYEQKDPLLIYKFESFELFRTMVQKMNGDVVSLLMKSRIPIREADDVQSAQRKKLDMSRMQTQKHDYGRGQSEAQSAARTAIQSAGQQDTREAQRHTPVTVEKRVGRNDPCPCGSGKKFKSCHGAGAV